MSRHARLKVTIIPNMHNRAQQNMHNRAQQNMKLDRTSLILTTATQNPPSGVQECIPSSSFQGWGCILSRPSFQGWDAPFKAITRLHRPALIRLITCCSRRRNSISLCIILAE